MALETTETGRTTFEISAMATSAVVHTGRRACNRFSCNLVPRGSPTGRMPDGTVTECVVEAGCIRQHSTGSQEFNAAGMTTAAL
jgi:hypothetical protein